MKCMQCGAESVAGEAYCPDCGQRFTMPDPNVAAEAGAKEHPGQFATALSFFSIGDATGLDFTRPPEVCEPEANAERDGQAPSDHTSLPFLPAFKVRPDEAQDWL
jgi:hypothetical protein